MKGKRPYLWVLAAVGLVLWAVPLALYAKGVFLPTVLWIPIYGVGLVLFLGSLGTLFWRACLENDPVLRQHDHAVNDERNVAIRRRAQAVSGEVLQWGVMAAAWLSIGLGAPLWVTLAAVGVFLAKSVLELCLMARYQREM